MRIHEFVKFLSENTVNDKIKWTAFNRNGNEAYIKDSNDVIEYDFSESGIWSLKFDNITLGQDAMNVNNVMVSYTEECYPYLKVIFRYVRDKNSFFENEIEHIKTIIK